MKQMYELKKMVTVSEHLISNLFFKTNYVTIVNKQPAIKKTNGSAEKKLTVPLQRPLMGSRAVLIIFRINLNVKRPQLSIKQQFGAVSDSSSVIFLSRKLGDYLGYTRLYDSY